MIEKQNCICHIFILSLVIAWVCQSEAQSTSQLSAHWLPTDLNYGELSKLTGSNFQGGNASSQINGYGILGTVTLSDVSTWLTTLQQNPSVRSGTVRWNPGVASKCNSGTVGCTKSIKVTILEYDYTSPNGSDCKATATIAADAILPPVATLVNSQNGQTYLPLGYPIQYALTAAPNSTASSCTYILTYPQPTQTLANTLCAQGNTSCTDSPCVPCNANATEFGPTNEANCLPTSGVAPALVAAIEGAALCLSPGGMGSFKCQINFSANNSACSNMHCFPGDALVQLESRKAKHMRDLKIGDRVKVLKKDGTLGFEDIYFFGHRESQAFGRFVRITLETRPRLLRRQLELSSHHFVYIQDSGTSSTHKAVRAKSVRIGDKLRISQEGSVVEAEVVSTESIMKQGLWNPYTMGGTIVVNDVIASAHSEWIFDKLLDCIGQPHYLPAFYQALLAPIRCLYVLLGPQAMMKLDAFFDFGTMLTSYPFVRLHS